jgi:hypothetical protein
MVNRTIYFRIRRVAILACSLTISATSPSLALRREAYSADVVLSMGGKLERSTAQCATLAPCWVVVPRGVVVTIFAYPLRNSFFMDSAISAEADDYGFCKSGLVEVPADQDRVAFEVCRTRTPRSGTVGVVYIRIRH